MYFWEAMATEGSGKITTCVLILEEDLLLAK